ncbi:hypothetical protein GCM10023093_07110 [Nemorincola caseinilytica]|uniref:Uncharacterized protein n=1 Tax=Nemorincola caseinilytica TaxID=2054315 RepID=A0ABP8N5R6_9BACT
MVLLCSSAVHTYGQGSSTPPDVGKTLVKVVPPTIKPIKAEISFGYRLGSDGWSLYMDYGKIRSRQAKMSDMFHDVRLLQLEFSEKKHPKQQKIAAPDNGSGNSSNYVYGKINNFYGVKAGIGMRRMLAGKPDPGCVSIHWTTIIGPALGLLKPYYIVTDANAGGIKFSEQTQDAFLDTRNITGSGGFSMGLSEVKAIPGGHLKTLLHFDFAANRKTVTAIETGASVEYYAEAIPLMFNQPSSPYFVNLFVAFQFGKRW